MLGHYFTAAWRNLRATPFVSALNVFTLAIGFAMFFAAYGFVRSVETTDGHFAKADRTYVITTNFTVRASGFSTGEWNSTPAHVAKYLKTDLPEFETVARLSSIGEVAMAADERKGFLHVKAADPSFLEALDLPFVKGNAVDALDRPGSVVLTLRAARQIFGGEDPMGRAVILNNAVRGTVTGVIDPVAAPPWSVTRFDVLTSWDIGEAVASRTPGAPPLGDTGPEYWITPGSTTTFAVLAEGSRISADALNAKLTDFVRRRVPADQLATADYRLQAKPMPGQQSVMMTTMALGPRAGAITLPGVILFLGALVLAVACINYANLAAAQSLRRTKDVGTRKVLGASRGQVVVQFLLEATIITVLAAILVLGGLAMLLPALQAWLGLDFDLLDPWLWVSLALLIVVVNVAGGAYPAFILSQVNPIDALRAGPARARRGLTSTLLTGAQFLAASFFLVSVLVMNAQNDELARAARLSGPHPLLVIENSADEANIDMDTLRAELARQPGVKSVAAVRPLPWSGGGGRSGFSTLPLSASPQSGSRQVLSLLFNVSDSFFETMQIRRLAGRGFERERGEDQAPPLAAGSNPARPVSIIVDEEFVRLMGLARPQDVIGRLYYNRGSDGEAARTFRIIGVVEAKPLSLMALGMSSQVYVMSPSASHAIIRVSQTDVAGARAEITQSWNRLAPNVPLKLRLLNERFDTARNSNVIEAMFQILVVCSFAVAAMGLFAMAIHATRRRLHEIGVRKTLGASSWSMVWMLLRDFSIPVVIANLLAWPLAYLAMRTYLNLYVHRIDLAPAPFVTALVLTVAISWLAISWQAYRAARVNPSAVLRYE